MAQTNPETAILLIHAPDQQGLVAAVSGFIARRGGNVVSLDQHVDAHTGVFFMRVEWQLSGFAVAPEALPDVIGRELAEPMGMAWQLHFSDQRPRLAVFVSKLPHCLYDILSRWQSGEWRVDIPLIISNHETLRPVAEQFGIPFHCFPITADNKADQERRELELLQEHAVDLVVLARYMQIVSPVLVEAFPERMINIHHSFLPAFAGAKPYHAAHERGVKIIGATSHYVTEDLDAGPIIDQDVSAISHRDAVEDLIRKGRDLEKIVLARAVWSHLQRNVLCYGNRTVVFD